MPYVSARYAPPPPPEFARQPGDPKQVIATDDLGVEWTLTEDSQVGDWLRYIEGGGTVAAAKKTTRAKTRKKETR